MISIGLFEAKAQLGQLAQTAAAGEVVVLTRRGRPVAEIRAADPARGTAEQVSAAIAALRQWRGTVKLGPVDIAELVQEGRRA